MCPHLTQRETSLQRAERVQRQAALDHEIAKEMLRDAKVCVAGSVARD